jgi:predicted nuclease with RNAse H fold
MKSQLIVVGIDVGGSRKGFHGVALGDGRYFRQFHTTDPAAMAHWCREIGARLIGIDAPCRWSEDGRARPAERQLMGRGIQCFASPTRKLAIVHPRNYYGWMLNGEALYQAIAPSHPLCSGLPVDPRHPCCFETFPQAIACTLAGRILPAKDKRRHRPALLAQAGVRLPSPAGIDTIDAGLCALVAHRLSTGHPCTAYGEPVTGLIIVPNSEQGDWVRGRASTAW